MAAVGEQLESDGFVENRKGLISLGYFIITWALHAFVLPSIEKRNLYSNDSYSSNTLMLEQKVKELEACLEKEKELRKSERASRINIQRRAREEKTKENLLKGFTYNTIGFIRSPFGKRCGTPRQPTLCPAAKGRICFDKSIIQAEHFQEIRDFSHIWVIWSFHVNTNTDSSSLSSKVKPPRCTFKVGCLSTRSPHRPNPIGLSVVQVLAVGSDYIDIACVDMLDGTPVLDGKVIEML